MKLLARSARAASIGGLAIAALASACGSNPKQGIVECPQGSAWNGQACVWTGPIVGAPASASTPAPAPSVASSAPGASAEPAEDLTITTGEPIASAAPPPTAPPPTAKAGACGCAPADLNCSMKCAAQRSGGPTSWTCQCPSRDPQCISVCGAPPSPPSDQPFDRGAALQALIAAGQSAKGCKTPSGPTGRSKVRVVFSPSGRVKTVELDPPYAGTPVGACVATAYRAMKIPSFAGGEVTVSKPFEL